MTIPVGLRRDRTRLTGGLAGNASPESGEVRMLSNFDLNRAFQLVHHHGGDKTYPMYEEEHPALDAADDDPERAWNRGSRVFRCSGCDERIAITQPSDDEPREAPDRPS
jgi:hypothetical protein